jgi:hypothetical protein
MMGGGSPASGGSGLVSQLIRTCAPAPFPQYDVNPGGITFALPPQAGISGYRVFRQDLGELTSSPVVASFTHQAPLEYFSTYQYDVMGAQSSGGCTTSSARITPPKPLTPVVTANAVSVGPTHRVTISWASRNDHPTHHLVLGPGLPPDGIEVPEPPGASQSGGALHSIDTGNLVIGTYGWLVTPMWKTPAGVMIDVSTGGRATATVGGGMSGVVSTSSWNAIQAALQKAADAYKAMLNSTNSLH